MNRTYATRKYIALSTVFLGILLSFATETQARAYTDPGSGALIWQILMASFVGAAFYIRRFTSWFRKKTKPDEEKVSPIER